MKFLLIALNAKYIHSNLAVHSLRAYCLERFQQEGGRLPQIGLAEYTINQPLSEIRADIYERKADVLFFSCYIWNRREVEQLVQDLGKVSPQTEIWLGGPEVSFDVPQAMEAFAKVRGIIRGEGEDAFFRIVQAYGNRGGEDGALGFREVSHTVLDPGGMIAVTAKTPFAMDALPFPYEDTGEFANRIIYYESSRGCPFRCSYCLSSIEKSLRFKSPELVKRQLAFFLEHNVKQVKFVDRTFNCNHDHALEIWRYLQEHDNGVTNFHFEIAGGILSDEGLDLLGKMRPGQVQLEIGVQSVHERTLREINRPADFGRVSQVVRRLKQFGNIHLHLDLIAGLPYEDMESFKHSFNEVFSLKPHQLQLGFLKVLKGSPLAESCASYGLKYSDAPPYEVLETKWISYGQLLQLKAVEEMVEIYYNSGQYMQGLEVLLDVFPSPFAFFEKLAAWYRESGLSFFQFSRNQRYEHLLRFGKNHITSRTQEEVFQEALLFDYYSRANEKNRPAFFGAERVEKAFAKEFYSMEARRHRYLKGPQYEDTADPRVLRKLTHLEKLGDSYYLFDYANRNPVTGNAGIIEII